MTTHRFIGDAAGHVCDLVADYLDEHLWLIEVAREDTAHYPILEALEAASSGVRDDCHWAPDTGALRAVPVVAAVVAQITAARASNALTDGNPA